MRTMAVGTLSVVAALGVAAVAADAQTGATQYGGSVVSGKLVNAVSIGLTRGVDGRVTVRLGFAVVCHRILYEAQVVKASGTTTGASFHFSGHTKVGGTRLTMTGSGAFAGTGADGRLSARGKGCDQLHGARFTLRAALVPGGPPAVPAKGTRMFGVSGQSSGAVRLPVSLHVSATNRVEAIWDALAACPGGRIPIGNHTPSTPIRADGSFSRSEKYTLKYRNGSHDTFHVTFAGRFFSAGVSGTLSARMQRTGRHGKRFKPCVSGLQTWTATP